MGDLEEQRQVSEIEIEQLSESLQMRYMLTSAKRDENVSVAFEAVLRVALRLQEDAKAAGKKGNNTGHLKSTNCRLQ